MTQTTRLSSSNNTCACARPQERTAYALRHIGGEVLNGAFTTWLAVIVLAGANHYIFQSFFKLLFALIVLAIWCVCACCSGPQPARRPVPHTCFTRRALLPASSVWLSKNRTNSAACRFLASGFMQMHPSP